MQRTLTQEIAVTFWRTWHILFFIFALAGCATLVGIVVAPQRTGAAMHVASDITVSLIKGVASAAFDALPSFPQEEYVERDEDPTRPRPK